MPYEVKLPDIGEGVAEGEIVRWLVKVGDAVREDQPLVEVMTDKASVEIPAPRTGRIGALLAEEGSVVPVGTVIVSIDVAGEDVTAEVGASARSAAHATGATAAGAAVGGSTATASAGTAPSRVQATPAVRQLAKQLGVALERVAGTGPGGAVSADDVKRAAGSAGPEAGAGAASGEGSRPAPPGTKPGGGDGTAAASSPLDERIPVRGLRRLIAEHMRRSIDTAAHFTFVAECDMTSVVEHRQSVRAKAEAAGVRLTYLAYIVRALIESLRRFPFLNASLDDERQEIVLRRAYHIGIATHTDEGLTVPVLRDADRLSLFAAAREIQRLSEAARAGRLKLEELQGGTFTITSTGAKGGVLATPILHHPQVAILGVHEVKKRPAVVDDRIVARDLGNFSLSLDHRVVDGAVGADFLYDLIDRLQQPSAWIQTGDLS